MSKTLFNFKRNYRSLHRFDNLQCIFPSPSFSATALSSEEWITLCIWSWLTLVTEIMCVAHEKMTLLLSLLDHYGVLQRRQKDGILSEFSKGGVDVLPYPFFTAQPNSQSKLSLVLTYHHSQLLECVDFFGRLLVVEAALWRSLLSLLSFAMSSNHGKMGQTFRKK